MQAAWTEYYSDEEIKKIQKIELKSLEVFDDICHKLNIQYFVYGGTLLGTIKYQGFVPWDDDLDIAMLRDDYELFLQKAPALLPEMYEIQHPSNNRRTPYPYIKFRRTDTAMVDYPNSNIKINHGVYFDIYPLDNIPDEEEEYKRLFNKMKWLRMVFVLRQNYRLMQPAKSPKDRILLLIRIILFLILHLIPHSYIVNEMRQTMITANSHETKRQGNYFFHSPTNHFDGIFPVVKGKFEGRTVNVPAGYRENLKNRYGDISKLPPIEKRVGHKAYVLNLQWDENH